MLYAEDCHLLGHNDVQSSRNLKKFQGKNCFHLQEVRPLCFSETSVNLYKSTWCHIPEDGKLHSQKCQKLKSRMLYIITTTTTTTVVVVIVVVVVVAAASTTAVQILSTLNLPCKFSQYRTDPIITIIYSSSTGLHHTKFVSNVTCLAPEVYKSLTSN